MICMEGRMQRQIPGRQNAEEITHSDANRVLFSIVGCGVKNLFTHHVAMLLLHILNCLSIMQLYLTSRLEKLTGIYVPSMIKA